MHRLSDIYQIPSLSKFAVGRFTNEAQQALSLNQIDDFCEAVKIAYTSTPETNRGMRDAIVSITSGNLSKLTAAPSFATSLRKDFPELAAEVLLGLNPSESKLKHVHCVTCKTTHEAYHKWGED